MGAGSLILRIILFLAGLTIMYTGVNVGFGGIQTLGLQGTNDFLDVTNMQRFMAQDSHVRFLGGIWLAFGILFVLGSISLVKFHLALKFAMAATFIGGLARFSQMNLSVTLGPDIIGSLAAELIVMPILYLWLSREIKKYRAKTNTHSIIDGKV